MTISGNLFIGSQQVEGQKKFRGVAAETGQEIEPTFSVARPIDIDQACALAAEAAIPYAGSNQEVRAAFLETMAENILALGDALIERAMIESGLPRARLEGERGRTVGQLRLFAAEIREGGWMGLRIDPAMPDRAPLPRPDLRLRNIPLGPVAVFSASNFPLAFSVAGGDTASALAAGCPVVVKAHPAHPGTSELVASAIVAAVQSCGFHQGVFSMIAGADNSIGRALVSDPRIKAVSFTGSRSGGLALIDIAAKRPEPIPVYAEMSAVNPVLLMPAALAAGPQNLAKAFVASLTIGAGQFCTNPGLILALAGPDLDAFSDAAAEAVSSAPTGVMLTPAIGEAYRRGIKRIESQGQAVRLDKREAGGDPNRHPAAVFRVSAETFRSAPELAEEVFGAASIIVQCQNFAQLTEILGALEGQLTATVHFTEADHQIVEALLPLLERKVGRVLANGWPTGVEVSHAMVHGGPFPATSDGRSTSVGTAAIERFLRLVCYQNFPAALLPPVLANPKGVPHRYDGQRVA